MFPEVLLHVSVLMIQLRWLLFLFLDMLPKGFWPLEVVIQYDMFPHKNFRKLGAFFHEFLLPRDAWTGPHPAKTVPAHWIRITRLVRHVLNLISRMSVFIQGLGSTTSGNVLSASLTAPSGKTAATHNSSAFTHPRSGILSFFPTAGEKGYRLNHIARRTKVIFR